MVVVVVVVVLLLRDKTRPKTLKNGCEFGLNWTGLDLFEVGKCIKDPRVRYVDSEGSIPDNNNWMLGNNLWTFPRCVPTYPRTDVDDVGTRTHFYPDGGWGWLVCAAGFLALLLTTGMQLAFGLLQVHSVKHFGKEHIMDLGEDFDWSDNGMDVGMTNIMMIIRPKLGWKRGMQSVTGALSLAFFLGLIYKSASVYHPQRRAMLHLKNQRGGKLKERRTAAKVPPRQRWVDLSPLGSRPVRMLMLAAAAAGFGLYTPAFYISTNKQHPFQAVHGKEDGLENSALVLLQTCLGLAAALGCAAWGVVTARPSAQCLVSRQYLCQAALLGVAIAQVALGSVEGYHGLVLASGLYGASLGGALYSLKMLALERLRTRHFARAWALVQAAEALPILLGVPLTELAKTKTGRTSPKKTLCPTLQLKEGDQLPTLSSSLPGYMNAYIPRVGYYACMLSSLCGAALLFLVGSGQQPASPTVMPDAHLSASAVPPLRTCPPPPRPRLPKSQSLHVPLNIDESLRDRDMSERIHHNTEHYYQPQFYGPIRPSKSVPEGLSHQDSYRSRPRRHRDVTVIEQITTCV
ncbi:uncharacterized protein LOC144474467 [Augochlora pura]